MDLYRKFEFKLQISDPMMSGLPARLTQHGNSKQLRLNLLIRHTYTVLMNMQGDALSSKENGMISIT